MSTNARLPEEFRDLERFSDWILETENERKARRVGSTMEEIRALYDAVLPRLDAIGKYLNRWRLDELDDVQKRLLWLALSFVEVTSAVELYGQPDVIEGIDPFRFHRVEGEPGRTP